MGLFDRWRAPAGGSAQSTTTAIRRPLLPVPDVDGPEIDEAVRAHLERLTAAAETDVDSLTPEQFDAALTSRLVARDRLQSTGLGFSYVVPFTDHIDEVLTLDLPTTVVTLPDSRLAATRRYVPTLMGIGRSNLVRQMEAADVEHVRLGSGRRSVSALVGDSPYTASFARFLLDAVDRWMPRADLHGGIVFAVPNRHSIVLQTCATAAETRLALELVPEQAAEMFDDGVGPVSPHVYHWYHREITCLTEDAGDGSLLVRPTPLLEGMMGRGGRRAG
ncbi:hypothetical protein [Phycicoccus avicenniae]|uniref:hypothetical protein n=1 Tax=Phycicoccus avicenniae TaxID=2828860 RepID=UPI003D293047